MSAYECVGDPSCPARVRDARPGWMTDAAQLLAMAEIAAEIACFRNGVAVLAAPQPATLAA